MGPLLSVCAILKDEAHNIKSFLDSWLGVADELILLDTGSCMEQFRVVIDTIFAHEEKAKVKVHIMIADQPFHFANARNKAKAACRGRWILWADLDDRIDKASVPAIRDIATNCDRAQAFSFQVYSPTPGGAAHRFLQVRMFLNHQGLEWKGACHETLDEALVRLEMPVQEVPEIIIAHLGYQDQGMKEAKARRNLAILEAQPECDVATCAQMGDSYYVLGEWSQGLRCFTNAYVQDPTWKERLAEKLLVGHLNLGHFLDAEEWLEALPDGITKRFWAGEIAWNRGDMAKALDLYKGALLCSPTISYAGSNEEALVCRAQALLASAGRGE